MQNLHAIKPGPKPKKDDGSDDRRRRVDPPTAPKHPDLKPHNPEPKKPADFLVCDFTVNI